jgi:hypothetical protein
MENWWRFYAIRAGSIAKEPARISCFSSLIRWLSGAGYVVVILVALPISLADSESVTFSVAVVWPASRDAAVPLFCGLAFRLDVVLFDCEVTVLLILMFMIVNAAPC